MSQLMVSFKCALQVWIDIYALSYKSQHSLIMLNGVRERKIKDDLTFGQTGVELQAILVVVSNCWEKEQSPPHHLYLKKLCQKLSSVIFGIYIVRKVDGSS